ncbi:MAG TPA: hypothetical protein VGR37_02920, partial [Longimicrobiaceae bacterium]|nr:hypothetical protein [Longimicrobiaceae bacterium]
IPPVLRTSLASSVTPPAEPPLRALSTANPAVDSVPPPKAPFFNSLLGLLLEDPLDQPIFSGPTCALVVWGLDDFQPQDAPDAKTLVFSEEDLYYRDCTPEDCGGYAIEVFIFPKRYLSAARMRGGKLTISLACLEFEATAGVLDFPLIVLPGQPIILGVLASRSRAKFLAPSGFTLSSPSDRRRGEPIANSLLAAYPDMWPDRPMKTLDYSPPDAL